MTILNNTFRIETSFYDRVICFVNTNQCLPHTSHNENVVNVAKSLQTKARK